MPKSILPRKLQLTCIGPLTDHGEILWNAAYELIRSLDAATDSVKASEHSWQEDLVGKGQAKKGQQEPPAESLTRGRAVGGHEVAITDGKAGSGGILGRDRAMTLDESYHRQAKSLNALRHILRALTLRGPSRVHSWDMLVQDVDVCLKEFHEAFCLAPYIQPCSRSKGKRRRCGSGSRHRRCRSHSP